MPALQTGEACERLEVGGYLPCFPAAVFAEALLPREMRKVTLLHLLIP